MSRNITLENKVKSRTITASFAFAADREFDLTLSEFSSAADPRTQTYKATLSMSQPEGINIKPGMTAEVHLYPLPSETTPGSAAFVIPALAVLAGDEKQIPASLPVTADIPHRKARRHLLGHRRELCGRRQRGGHGKIL